MSTRYTEQQRQQALTLYAEHGPREASRRTGIHYTTIGRWARDAGLNATDRAEKVRKAGEQYLADVIARRGQLTHEMFEASLGATQMVRKAVGGDEDQTLEMIASAAQEGRQSAWRAVYEAGRESAVSARNWAVVAGIMLDKVRLELGDPSSIEEQRAVSPVQRVSQAVDELASRREQPGREAS